MNYKQYLKSEHWKQTKEKAYIILGRKCNRCGSKNYLNIHHKHYQNIGCELIEDLEVVCKSCHEKIHDINRSEIPTKYAAKKIRKEIKRIRSMVSRNILNQNEADKMIDILQHQLNKRKSLLHT